MKVIDLSDIGLDGVEDIEGLGEDFDGLRAIPGVKDGADVGEGGPKTKETCLPPHHVTRPN